MIIYQLLKTIPFFESLEEKDNLKIIDNVRLHYLPPNYNVFKEGDIGDKMYVIRYGKIKIYKNEGNYEHTISILQEKDFFGEMALVSDETRNASAKTLEECEIFSISKDDLYELLQEKPEISKMIKDRFITRSIQNKKDQNIN